MPENHAPQRRRFLSQSLAASAVLLLGQTGPAAQKDSGMASAARTLLGALPPELKAKAAQPFEAAQRFDWHFVPKARKGASFKDLGPRERELVRALVRQGLSQGGYRKVTTIISLEDVLKEIEKGSGPIRDPDLYYVTIFGEPGGKRPWGWSFEGHHVSLNYTIGDGGRLSHTPHFLGSNPGEVLHGARKGESPLAAEERLGREVYQALDEAQRASATISPEAPRDILTGNSRRADPLAPAGIAASRLSGRQAEMLMRLLTEYTSRMPDAVAAQRTRELRAAGFNQIHFGWAGSAERFQPHYYRIQGPSFLLEYDNIQNNANHIHTVWRDFKDDFGDDLLARHHRESPHHHRRRHA